MTRTQNKKKVFTNRHSTNERKIQDTYYRKIANEFQRCI